MSNITLKEIGEKLSLHPLVCGKLFIDKNVFQNHPLYTLIPYVGHDFELIEADGPCEQWKLNIPEDIDLIRYMTKLETKELVNTYHISEKIREIEHKSHEKSEIAEGRTLLAFRVDQEQDFTARIQSYKVHSPYSIRVIIDDVRSYPDGCFCAHHSHLMVSHETKLTLAQTPIGTKLKFRATIHRYRDKNGNIKFGLHHLQNLEILTT
jgi:hypothetical protein